MNDYHFIDGNHTCEQELLKLEYGQTAYHKSIDLAELLGLDEDIYSGKM